MVATFKAQLAIVFHGRNSNLPQTAELLHESGNGKDFSVIHRTTCDSCHRLGK